MKQEVSVDLSGGKRISFETGKLAKQAHGAVLAQYGETVVLAPVVSAYDARPNICLLYTSPSPRDLSTSRMPSSA